MVSFTLIAAMVVLLALGIGIKMIPFFSKINFIEKISNFLIGIPLVAIAIIALFYLFAEVSTTIILAAIFDYWFLILVAIIIFILILNKDD